MQPADRLDSAVPAAYEALLAAGKEAGIAAVASGLEPRLIELVRIRSSQLNGCGYCLRLHTRDAIGHGESADRLAVIPAWRDTTYFTPVERAALAIAEKVTFIADLQNRRRGVEDSDLDQAALTAEQRAAVTWLAIVINAFNRIAIVSEYDVAPPVKRAS